MFVSIRLKLFLLIIVANALMVGVLMVVNAASFSRSFSDYVIEQESRRLQPLMQNIAAEYEKRGTWRWLKWDNPVWQSLVRQSFSPRDLRSMPHMQSERAGSMMNNGFFERLAVREAGTSRLLLGRRVPAEQRVWLPITAAGSGTVIAELGFQPSERLDNQFDRVFARQQQRQLVVIGLVGFLLAAVLAVPFSGWLVRPIQRLSDAVRRMTQGDLSVSVIEDRQDELGRLAADFNRLARALEKNQSDRQQWVSDIAHELRTPVAVFQADIEAAQDGVRAVNDAWLANLHAQVVRLTGLVNDLHLLSQSDAGTLSYRFAPTELDALVDDYLQSCRSVLAEQHIKLRWDKPVAPVVVRLDASRLNQLLANLLQNTLRYTSASAEQPGELHVSLIVNGRQAQLSWQDSSPGVGDADLPRLFERLYRVDNSRSRDSGGAGLGLSIVQNIAQAHDAHISARHSDLGGLRIDIELPLTEEDVQQ